MQKTPSCGSEKPEDNEERTDVQHGINIIDMRINDCLATGKKLIELCALRSLLRCLELCLP